MDEKSITIQELMAISKFMGQSGWSNLSTFSTYSYESDSEINMDYDKIRQLMSKFSAYTNIEPHIPEKTWKELRKFSIGDLISNEKGLLGIVLTENKMLIHNLCIIDYNENESTYLHKTFSSCDLEVEKITNNDEEVIKYTASTNCLQFVFDCGVNYYQVYNNYVYKSPFFGIIAEKNYRHSNCGFDSLAILNNELNIFEINSIAEFEFYNEEYKDSHCGDLSDLIFSIIDNVSITLNPLEEYHYDGIKMPITVLQYVFETYYSKQDCEDNTDYLLIDVYKNRKANVLLIINHECVLQNLNFDFND